MTTDEMTRLVELQLDAYNRRDLAAFCDCYHADVTVTNLIASKTTCHGIEQFKSIYRELFAASPDIHCLIKSRIVLDSAVVDEELATGLSRFPEGLHTVAIYSFREGKIDRVWFPR